MRSTAVPPSPLAVLSLALVGLALAGNACAGDAPAKAPDAAQPAQLDLEALRQQVRDTERAFARTMAERDLAAFTRFLAPDTIWFSGPGQALRGPQAVLAVWRRYFESPVAPFAWEPDEVEVLDSGSLALSTGPVRDPAGKLIGRFTSIWRREPDGRWLIVFDRGE